MKSLKHLVVLDFRAHVAPCAATASGIDNYGAASLPRRSPVTVTDGTDRSILLGGRA